MSGEAAAWKRVGGPWQEESCQGRGEIAVRDRDTDTSPAQIAEAVVFRSLPAHRRDQDHRHMGHLVVQADPVAEDIVLAELFPMVGCDDDPGILQTSHGAELEKITTEFGV